MQQYQNNIHAGHWIDNKHAKKDNTIGIEGGTILTSFETL
jgi:hypothetical protein